MHDHADSRRAVHSGVISHVGTEIRGAERKLEQFFHFGDLVPLAVSSVGPLFSIAATGGVMAAQAGWYTLPAIALMAIPFLISSQVFKLLNRHFPHAGASYHWSARVMGKGMSRFQAWVLILAYFTSIPPIIIPASSYTLQLIVPGYHPSAAVSLLVSTFWTGFALIPLLGGSKPTARITQVFFSLEMLSLVGLTVLGVMDWGSLHVGVHPGPPHWGGILVVTVIAATILDGWEIDSYAAEESKRPHQDPGKAGIVGSLVAFGFYVLLYPLILGETPMNRLAGSSDPLAVWGQRLFPHAPWLIIIPILASTAGGLWLTTYILTRALFAMGRERLIPNSFGRLNKRYVPSVAIVTSLGTALVVTAIELFFKSLSAFFGLVLSAAGFFLVVEFFFDSLTATVFLVRAHRDYLPSVHGAPYSHRHRLMLWASILANLMFGSFIVTFFVVGPKAIGSDIDWVLAASLVAGLLFTWITRRRAQLIYVFQAPDTDQEPLAAPVVGGVSDI